MKRKHTLTGKDNYPRYCDLCESVLDNKKDLKEHMKIHSYKKANKPICYSVQLEFGLNVCT